MLSRYEINSPRRHDQLKNVIIAANTRAKLAAYRSKCDFSTTITSDTCGGTKKLELIQPPFTDDVLDDVAACLRANFDDPFGLLGRIESGQRRQRQGRTCRMAAAP